MKKYTTRLIKSFILVSFILLNTTSIVSAQINMEWSSLFTCSGNFANVVTAQVDRLGNTYELYIISTGPPDTLLMAKLNPDGNLIWNKTITISSPVENYFGVQLLIDTMNCPIADLLIHSSSLDNNLFIRCDTSGTIVSQMSIPNTIQNLPSAIDKYNYLFIQYTRSSDSTMVLEKYDSNLNLMFQSSVFFYSGGWGSVPVADGNGNAWFGFQLTSPDTAKWFKVDSTGSVTDSLIIAGNFFSMILDTQNDMFISYRLAGLGKSSVRKYDSSMNLLWDTGPTDIYTITGMKVDSLGNLYAYSRVPASITNKVHLGKIDSSGNIKWILDFGLNSGGLSNYAYGGISIDSSDNPFIVGRYYSNGFTGTNQPDKFFIKRFDSNGMLKDLETVDLQGFFLSIARNYGNDLFVMTYSGAYTRMHKFCIDCRTNVSGTVYYDADSSCNFNINEHGIKDAIVKIIPGPLYLNTDSTGYYHCHLKDSNYNVIFEPLLNYDHSCMTDTVNVQISGGIPVMNVNSGCYMDSAINNLILDMGRGRIRAGRNTLFVINYKNAGGSVQSGSLDFAHDSILNFIQSFPPPSLITGDTLRWNFSGLSQGITQTIYVTLSTPASVSFGTAVNNLFNINGNLPDVTPSDNIVIDTGVVVGSYDPNDKLVSPAGSGMQGYISTSDSILKYTIHFENIGNDTAFNILVLDTLDSHLDIASLQIGVVSHPFSWDIIHSNILRFRFNNIQLADSSNPDQNSGFINYYIKQKPNLVHGTPITNLANIYFDYNLPILTNQTLNTIYNPLGIYNNVYEDGISLYPNPVSNWLSVYSDINELLSVSVFDMSGKLIYMSFGGVDKRNVHLDFSGLDQGVYALKLQTSKGACFRKIIKL